MKWNIFSSISSNCSPLAPLSRNFGKEREIKGEALIAMEAP
jgi:hypothetical protein